MSLAHHKIHYISNGAGWSLELKQCRRPHSVHKNRNPVVFIPGYGMNSFIFGYHPNGLSFEEYLTQHGLEVWSVNLRGQGDSRQEGGSDCYGLKDLGTVDLRKAIDFIVKNSESTTDKVDLIGCSLGGTLAYIYAALVTHNKLGKLVSMGAPLRWEEVHILLRIAFASPKLIGLLPLNKTKGIIRTLFPILSKTSLLKIYLHKEMVDLRHKNIFLETVEDPNRFLNREIAEWIHTKDLIIDGKNVTEEMKKVKSPLFCILANSDGIVPPMTALSAHEVIGSKTKETLVVGTDKLRFAHADLFISEHSHEMVFKPVAQWLLQNHQ